MNFASVDLAERAAGPGPPGHGLLRHDPRRRLGLQSGRVGPGLAFYGRGSYQETDGFRDRSGSSRRAVLRRLAPGRPVVLQGLRLRRAARRRELAFLAVEPDDPRAATCASTRSSPEERDRFGQQFVQAQSHALPRRALRAWPCRATTTAPGAGTGSGRTPERALLYQYELDWHFVGGLVTFRHAKRPLDLTAGTHVNGFTSEHGRARPWTRVPEYTNHGHKNEANGFAKLGYDAGASTSTATPRSATRGSATRATSPSARWTGRSSTRRSGARCDLGPALGRSTPRLGRATREPARGDMLAGEDNPTIALRPRGRAAGEGRGLRGGPGLPAAAA